MSAGVSAAIGIHAVEPIPPATTTTSSPEGPLSQWNSLSAPEDGQEAPVSEEETPTGFLAVTLAELRKVVWPSRQQLFSESVAVILMVSLSAAAIAAIDRFYHWGSAQIFR